MSLEEPKKKMEIQREAILGQGGYGIVYKGFWGPNRIPVAVKRLQLVHLDSSEKEEEALQNLKHPNIIKIYHAENDTDFRYFALELCEASMDKLFLQDDDSKKCRRRMPPREDVLYQLAQGLKYIHKMGMTHHDIKPENVLIWVDSKDGQVIMKWADFGLRKGKYGIVYEGVWRGNQVAIKRIPLDHATISNEREVNALKKFDHENVIKLFHDEKDTNFKFFVLELCKASLDKLFLKGDDPEKYSGPMPSEAEVLLQLAKGLEHIHKNGLVHRDIKPQNVLIWVNPQTKQVLMKWADFGFSKQVNERGTFTMSGVRGTLHWLAPEILKLMDEDSSTDNEDKKRGTVKSDVFAEGLVFGYFLSEGVHPFGTSNIQIPINVGKMEPANLPKRKKIRNIIRKMLDKEPDNRIASSDVVALLKEEKEGKAIEIDVNCKTKYGSNALTLLYQNYQKENLKEITGLLMQSGLNVTPETVTFFKEKYHKENRDEILLLLDQQHSDEPVTKRMKFE
ncbi:calcium-dependent protein kinase 2-like [Daphnia pulex]|uniref:calcium-dependent protein kinase 2-like n=1 Tax=Daphnia pulex TaxID=6669 RepID=UPI001EDCF2D5|nr:calcium-dependent protein kinase 2-like [Daphnia pulex]